MEIKQYRRKEIFVNAIQWSGLEEDIHFIQALGLFDFGYTPVTGEISIEVKDTTMIALPGDYIVKGMSGEFYPCKKNLFESSYKDVATYQERKAYYPVGEERLTRMLEVINNGGTPRDLANEFGISHQAVEDFLRRHGHDYALIFRERMAKKKQLQAEKRAEKIKRVCKLCGKPYSLDDEGAGTVYCSRECDKERRRIATRLHNRIYYKTEIGKKRQQEYKIANREKINEYVRGWQRRHRANMTPEQLDEYRKKMAAAARRHTLKKRLAKQNEKT